MKKFLSLFTALLLLGSMTVVHATDYYYRGNQNGWGATLMTTSTDGYYAYISALSFTDNNNQNNEFKISLTDDSWDYGCSIASSGFNGTDITDMNNSSNSWNVNNSNNAIYHNSSYYVLVYFPNTAINSSDNPVMCASTTLPNNSAPASDVYTVVGDVPGLGWTPENTDLDMTENNGVYTFAMENVELTANTAYYYKMVQNHSWAVSYPQEGNASFSIETAGIYDLTFTLDLSAATPQSVTPTLKEAAVVIPTIKMTGTFADALNWNETAEFTLSGNKETATLTLENLPAGTYDFLVMSGSSYLGNGHTFYREYTGASNITGNEGNMHLEADVAGDYTFTWTYEGNVLSIDFPAEPTPEYVEIKFFAPRDETNKWEQVYAYSYKGSRKFLGEWPGTKITSTKDAGWYTVSVRKGSNLIFTDNAGMETNAIEDIQAAACYESTSIYYPEEPTTDPKKVTVTANANCAVTYHISGSAALLGGESDFAINVALDANNQIEFQNVQPGTYSFKINNGTWAWAIGGNDHLKSGDCASIAATVGQGDVGFQIETAQDITITYYPEEQEICLGAVTVPVDFGSYQRTVTAGNYGTICLPNNGTMSNNAKLYDLEYFDGASTLYFLEVDGNAMVAGRPYIFLPSETSIEVTYIDNANATAGSNNGLVGSYTQETITADAGNYILWQNAYYLVNSPAYVGANRAYIHMDGVPTAPQQTNAPRRRVAMNVYNEQTTTDIDALNASETPVKMIIDGNLYILRGENLYNVNGQVVK